MNLSSILTALGINAVPAAGWFAGGWSSGTMLAVYWFENLAFAFFLALQILIHRRSNHLRGHFAYLEPGNDCNGTGTYLGAYLPRILGFIFVHAIFLGLLLFLFFPKKFGPASSVDPQSFFRGSGLVLLFLVMNFLINLPGLRRHPFRWLESAGLRSHGRIILVQLTIMGGMFLAILSDSPRGLFGIFILLKTLTDLGGYLPQYSPKSPPRWLVRLASRIGFGKKGESFTDCWLRTGKAEKERQARNEEILP